VVRPLLPRWVDRLDLSGLRVAGATVDLLFERTPEGVQLAGAQVDGALEIVRERPSLGSS